MQITRTDAVKLFAELGVTTANKWNSARMAAKLQKLEEAGLVDRDTEVAPEMMKTLKAVVNAIHAGEDIEVVAEVTEKSTKTPEPEQVPEKPKKEKAAPVQKKQEPEKAASTKTPTRSLDAVPGVRKTRSRSFLAGIVAKEYGYEEITQEMVDRLNELYGKKNDAESFYTLRDAVAVVRGFVEGEKA